jgi:hypothetical protein
MLTDLYDDIQGVLLQKLDNTTLIMLLHVNKKYYELVSKYRKINSLRRNLFCEEIASDGYLEVLKWARENGYDWNSWTCVSAAENGDLEMLVWARENGCDWDSSTCYYAAKNGHLEVLKWAIKNGCEWNINICYLAVINGHLEVLKWARENECEWNSDIETFAKQKWPTIFS